MNREIIGQVGRGPCIILDPNLSFAKHIANLVSVVNFKAYSFTKFRHMLTKSAAIRLYKSMILPYLDYGDSIYGGANQDLLQKLQRLQNRCLRKIAKDY